MPAIALSTDTSILTAGANDIGYDNVFARQVEALANPGDLVIMISTSGKSENLLRAAKTARDRGAATLGILGKGGGPLAGLCDRTVIVPSDDTQHIQEMHEIVGHLLCGISEQALHGEGFEDAHP
jgi:D-sedoheptulose 7-phosphate isomerase